jgi:kinesin family protein 18/19
MIEGANINRSLLALGNCINMLHENNVKNQQNYIPFRDSKLTRLLKDSLGGNCRTVMIANIAPSSSNYEDTHNTLKYANRAKNIKTRVQRNVLNVEYHVSQYTDIIAQLRNEIHGLKENLTLSNNNPAP